MLTIGLDRQEKRNAINDETIAALDRVFSDIPAGVRAVRPLRAWSQFFRRPRSQRNERTRRRRWRRAFARLASLFRTIEFGPVPVVAALKGAVIGGGSELAAAAHLRVAEPIAYYALPEGQRGIFVGGGGSVRLPRLIGVARMADMMLTGRVYGAEEGARIGFAQYLVGEGESFAKAMALAEAMAGNAPLTNFAVIQALPRIADADPSAGYLMESLVTGIAQGDGEAKIGMRAFLDKRAARPSQA